MRVEVWSDVVCPWCYIGKRRLEAALASLEDPGAVEVIWRSFQLDPNAPAVAERPLRDALALKYGVSPAQVDRMIANVAAEARKEGLAFNLDLAQGGNTLDAHRLLHRARDLGFGDALKERLLRAYFTEGRPIADREVLLELWTEVGLDPAEARGALASDELITQVRAEAQRASALGARGVPFFVFNGSHAVSGAQPQHVLRQVMEQALHAEAVPSPTCGDEGCEMD